MGRKWLQAIRCSASASSEKIAPFCSRRAQPADAVSRESGLDFLHDAFKLGDQMIRCLRVLFSPTTEQRLKAAAQPLLRAQQHRDEQVIAEQRADALRRSVSVVKAGAEPVGHRRQRHHVLPVLPHLMVPDLDPRI